MDGNSKVPTHYFMYNIFIVSHTVPPPYFRTCNDTTTGQYALQIRKKYKLAISFKYMKNHIGELRAGLLRKDFFSKEVCLGFKIVVRIFVLLQLGKDLSRKFTFVQLQCICHLRVKVYLSQPQGSAPCSPGRLHTHQNLSQAKMHVRLQQLFFLLFAHIPQYNWVCFFLLLLLLRSTVHFHFQTISKNC